MMLTKAREEGRHNLFRVYPNIVSIQNLVLYIEFVFIKKEKSLMTWPFNDVFLNELVTLALIFDPFIQFTL